MLLALTEDQTLLSRTALGFVAEHAPLSQLRKLRDTGDERGYSRATYSKMAELGWTAIPFSEEDGGLGMGLAELILVTEAMGRTLAPEPLIPSVVLAGRALALAGSSAQKSEWLAPLIAGDKVLAFAHSAPRGRYDLTRLPFVAQRSSASYKLTGKASAVWGGQLADGYVVAARTAGQDGERDGISLFVLSASSKGLKTQRQTRVDSLNVAELVLEGVELSESHLLGRAGEGYAVLSRVVDEATVALCGEMLGGMSEALERTRVYLRERRQFGVLIGSFQALKHRAARLFVELELSRSAVMAAARALDGESPDAALLVSVAKARLSDAYCLVANEAVQMHGGIGMTDEHDIGFFMKRARVSELTFGDSTYHRDRFATLSNY
jgi:alkylation response protein AidB-like acyl-CoA dehydrogenase